MADDTEARIAALEETNKQLRALVDELKAELDTTEARIAAIEKGQGGGGGNQQQQQGGNKKKKEKKKGGGGKQGGGASGGDAPKQTKKEAEREKKMKAAIKEGGKKGQDLSGMHDLGGMSYFTVALEKCEGDWELMQAAMDGATKEVDESG